MQIQTRGKDTILAQTEVKYQTLTNGQVLSAIYASNGGELVLLSAVLHPKATEPPKDAKPKDAPKDK